MNIALKNARAMSACQFAWDNATLEDSISPIEYLYEQIHEELDRLDVGTVASYASFCDELAPSGLIAPMIRELGLQRWESTRNAIGRRNPELADALGELVWSIDKQRAAFTEHEARRRLAAEAQK